MNQAYGVYCATGTPFDPFGRNSSIRGDGKDHDAVAWSASLHGRAICGMIRSNGEETDYL